MPFELNNTLDAQRATALKLHIEPVEAGQQAALASSIAKVLSDLVASYESFLLAEFLLVPAFKAAYEANNQVFDTIKQNMALRAVDLSFASCDVMLAPTLSEETPELFDNQVKNWEREVFPVYRDEIVDTDLNDTQVLGRVIERYTPEQRAGIFRPLMSMIGDGSKYKLSAGRGAVAERRLRKPNKELIKVYVPKVVAEVPAPPADKNIVAYMQVRTKGNGIPDLSRKGIKQVFYTEEVENGLYPFKPDTLRFNGYTFILNKKLNTSISYNDGLFYLENEELDIMVWGKSREEAEEAFAFSFYSLYINYAMEDDENLSPEAIDLKQTLTSLIQNVVQN